MLFCGSEGKQQVLLCWDMGEVLHKTKFAQPYTQKGLTLKLLPIDNLDDSWTLGR